MLVMTFNLRFANPVDGPNEWEHRKDLVVETIRRHAPDLLATQEGTTAMLRFLEAELTEYRPLPAQRPVDETCQYPSSFYRAGRFTVQESREFWLSQTPEVHRSCSWGSAFPRMVTYGLLQEKGRTETFYLINTHLDNRSPEARLQGARMIREYFTPLGRPLILAGDFNESPDEAVYREFTRDGAPWLDTWRSFHPRGEEATSQHQFDGEPRGARIDWILVTPPFRVRRVALVTDNQDNRYPSDHFPYEAEVDY
ncbi:MAG: endonuclease/exonuclease/phosphatase family protein [Deltaproteobacteria bacterium]|nr:endonuclease/exonuclease/phosphatase family protein [Deltaproteobacteria bacterium]